MHYCHYPFFRIGLLVFSPSPEESRQYSQRRVWATTSSLKVSSTPAVWSFALACIYRRRRSQRFWRASESCNSSLSRRKKIDMETTTQSEMPAGAGKSSLNPDALNELLGRMVNDLGAAVNGALVVLGDGLGIYTALADIGPATSQKLAEKTNFNERQLREWLSAQAASGYISYDAASDSFFLTPEQTAVFADPDSPAAMIGGFYSVSAVYHDEPLVAESFRTGRGLPWGGHNNCLFCGTERFFRPGYQANIGENWIPALDGVQQKLGTGTRVADIGCGHGISTLIMAKAFPKSEFYGFDLHPASIEAANRHTQEQQIPNVRFSIATAKDFPGNDYGFVTVFDALHDMGDPVGAASYVKQSLQPDGTFMIVEPLARDSLAENINPVGRVY